MTLVRARARGCELTWTFAYQRRATTILTRWEWANACIAFFADDIWYGSRTVWTGKASSSSFQCALVHVRTAFGTSYSADFHLPLLLSQFSPKYSQDFFIRIAQNA